MCDDILFSEISTFKKIKSSRFLTYSKQLEYNIMRRIYHNILICITQNSATNYILIVYV